MQDDDIIKTMSAEMPVYGKLAVNPEGETVGDLNLRFSRIPWLLPTQEPDLEKLQQLVNQDCRHRDIPAIPLRVIRDWGEVREIASRACDAKSPPTLLEEEGIGEARQKIVSILRERGVASDLEEYITGCADNAHRQRRLQIVFTDATYQVHQLDPYRNYSHGTVDTVPATARLEMFEQGLWPIGPVGRQRQLNLGRLSIPIPLTYQKEFAVFIPPIES